MFKGNISEQKWKVVCKNWVPFRKMSALFKLRATSEHGPGLKDVLDDPLSNDPPEPQLGTLQEKSCSGNIGSFSLSLELSSYFHVKVPYLYVKNACNNSLSS